ncbi:aldose 1-epimerase family protein [Roseisalinus antarcticus]|uniref:DUF4432 domain-containing protein n=1 Tax=Roseisalinus antarcticus TaxID=254357 RepID=A0A1Y5TND7_9RHOB|nr:aldose 1-epimerase family protein [Roseisalinus antarcticus]SLN66225.1 hypothetical protein ROA7023_03141 [Roseisalinus antarcticus]
MTDLFGRSRTRAELSALTGDLSAFGGVRLLSFGDGAERGQRMLEFRTGSGLRFTVMVDRGMDIAEVEHKGRAIGWQGPTGYPAGAAIQPEAEDGLGIMRGFSGFLVTCGLDHILGDATVDAASYDYPRRDRVHHGLHGRVSLLPARLTGYGERWDGDTCTLWAEGEIRQAANFAEHLRLVRRIEAELGGDEIRITDRVTNAGFAVTPHMFFYHVNLGHPLLDDGARLVAPVDQVIWASHSDRYNAQGVGYDVACAPRAPFTEQVWEHDMAAAADGAVPVALINDRLGLGLQVETRKDELPCCYQWQNFRSGAYALGIEPSTHHVTGNAAARERGEMIWLDPLEERSYSARFTILDGAEAIVGATDRIAAIAAQPATPFPQPTGTFPQLTGKGRRGAA